MALTIQCLPRLRTLGAIVLILAAPCWPTNASAQGVASGKYLVYVGTYTDHGSKGIYAYRFDARTGKSSALGLAAETPQPSFLTVDPSGHFLYAVNELESYQGQPTGAVSAFAIDPAGGKLSLLNVISSRDGGPAHITLDQTGKYALVSNYTRGSIAVFPVLRDGRLGDASAFVQHHGSSVNKERQEGPHAHAVAMSPDNHFAMAADLGLDQIFAYPFDAANGTLGREPHITKTHPGSGPRHLVFGPNGKFLYVINEMESTVVAFAYGPADGELRELSTISTLPEGFSGDNTAAEIAIHPNGRFLYASNRGADSIAVFSIDPAKGTLARVESVSTNGKTPRNFAIDPTGSWLLAANQDSDDIVVFRINRKTGRLTPSGQVLQVSSPTCLEFVLLP
ncbi:MAG: lactonase family protein [Terriglobales bacterium]